MPDIFPLFHWSPTSRRGQINRYGFRTGMWCTERLWKPPFTCFADNPQLAWSLSGATQRGKLHSSWDLWQIWSCDLQGFEKIIDDRNGLPKEYRVYHRIYKRDIWYVATRSSNR